MQVYVNRQALAGSANIGILASYPDEPLLAIDLHGSAATRLLFPVGISYPKNEDVGSFELPPNWRVDHKIPIINGEANRRIVIVFPEFKQRNSSVANQERVISYGSDVSQWPDADKTWRAEYERGWTYIRDVRNQSNVLNAAAMPTDPTDDSHWPAMIPPVDV